MSKIDASGSVAEVSKNVVVEIINRSLSAIDNATIFLQKEIPDVIMQFLYWNAVSSLLAQIFAVLGLVIWFVAVNYARKQDWAKSRDSYTGKYEIGFEFMFPVAIISVITVIFAVVVIYSNFDWLKIWIAPKIYLIEYAASMMRK